MTQIIAVLNHKGGVGKSTTAVSLAAALQLSKKNVLAIDMDGQANLTEALGLSIEEEQTVYGAMCGQYTLPLVKLHNGITVSPSCLDLSAAELELISEPGRELILKGLITKAIAKEHFDYIIIDCPPSLGLLTLNALTAADYIIIPVQAQYLAMRGMAKLMDIIRIVQERLNSNLKVGGIVITQYDRRKTSMTVFTRRFSRPSSVIMWLWQKHPSTARLSLSIIPNPMVPVIICLWQKKC